MGDDEGDAASCIQQARREVELCCQARTGKRGLLIRRCKKVFPGNTLKRLVSGRIR